MHTIRKPKLTEVAGIKHLLDLAGTTGDVLRRPLMELYENVRDFYTYVDEQGVGGCCALHIDTADLAEVRSLVVRPDLRGQHIGARLLTACLDEARMLNIARVYALTRSPVFFAKNGFTEIDKKELPHKVFNDCVRCPSFPDCDELAVIIDLAPLADGGSETETARMTDTDSKTGITETIGFLGFGNMGAAIARGLLDAGTISPKRLLVYDIDAGKCAEAEKLGAVVVPSPAELARLSDVLVLAVKPQGMPEALEQIRSGWNKRTLVVSIAAGISCGYIQERLGKGTRVVRVMPNTPALVKAGAAAIAPSPECTHRDAFVAETIFRAVGEVERVPESLIDAVTALSGSGPAYFFLMVESLVKAAVAQGMPEPQATTLAAQTLLGAGKLLKESQESPATLRERVTSKGGTTAAALAAFQEGGFERLVKAGVDAAAARAKELGK